MRYAAPTTRPERRRAIPLDTLAPLFRKWNRANQRAKNAYYEMTGGPAHHTLPDGRRDN